MTSILVHINDPLVQVRAASVIFLVQQAGLLD